MQSIPLHSKKRKRMRYQYKVKNFRVFDEEGVKVDMAPITILTGCNSSGKSSFVKSMLLINEVLSKISRVGKVNGSYRLDFTKKPNSLLGSYDNVIHRGSESKSITIEYTVPSLLLNEDVVVSLVFNRSYKLNGGELTGFSIARVDGTVLFQSESDQPPYGVSLVHLPDCCKDLSTSFFRYVYANNNRALLYYIMRGKKEALMQLASKHEVNENAVNRRYEEVESYYKSNQEWIDKIIAGKNPHCTSSCLESSSNMDFGVEITNEQIINENLFYFPCLDSLYESNKENFRTIAQSLAENGKDSDAFDLALCYIEFVAKGFENSKFSKFSEYIDSVSDEFFCKGIDLFEQGFERQLSFGRNLLLPEKPMTPKELRERCGGDALGDLYNFFKLLSGVCQSKNFSEIYDGKRKNWYFAYLDYIDLVIKEILSYRIPTDISYISTSTVNIKRLYSFDERDEMSELFKDYILSYTDCSYGFADKWLRNLNIGKTIGIKTLSEGTGCEVRIYQENDEKGQLLADFGYGISQMIFLLLRITMEANRRYPIFQGSSDMDYEEDKEKEMRFRYGKPLTIVLEEPEVHLHPKFQSMIADILLDAYKQFNFHFIVETHSEYLIRRSQVLVSKMGFKDNVESVEKNPFVTYYIPENSKPYSLGYRKDGKFMESFGSGFYDEASNLAFELL